VTQGSRSSEPGNRMGWEAQPGHSVAAGRWFHPGNTGLSPGYCAQIRDAAPPTLGCLPPRWITALTPGRLRRQPGYEPSLVARLRA
jgi:hypothetical protein